MGQSSIRAEAVLCSRECLSDPRGCCEAVHCRSIHPDFLEDGGQSLCVQHGIEHDITIIVI